MNGNIEAFTTRLTRNVTPFTGCYEQINQSTGLSSAQYDKVFIHNGYCKLPSSLNAHSAVNPPVETGLAVTLWIVAIICLLLIIFFCVIVLVGMTVMIFISFHQQVANQNLQQMQIKLLVTLSKSLQKKKHSQHQDVGNKKRSQNSRIMRNTIPFYGPSNGCNFFSPSVSNSAFHPRNNTPVSSNFNLSLSSHASLSNSGPPSFSSTSHSISEDSWNESQCSSGLTVVHPVIEHTFQRTRREGVEEEDQHERKSKLYDFRRRREFQQLPHSWQEQGSDKYKWQSITSSQQMNSPREYWL